MIPWLESNDPFPPVEHALREPRGLLAAGGDLSVKRLVQAYRRGIFPWFSEGDPILWWSPSPRMVLFPNELKVSRSLRKTLRKDFYEVRSDTAFRDVMEACAAPRINHSGTWITPEMVDAYTALHEHGFAHSVETWVDNRLVGGLYGVALGRIFFGESMFSTVTDASKIAFACLVKQLSQWGFGIIDCQMRTSHLASLGAREIPRKEFMHHLEELVNYSNQESPWRFKIRASDWLSVAG